MVGTVPARSLPPTARAASAASAAVVLVLGLSGCAGGGSSAADPASVADSGSPTVGATSGGSTSGDAATESSAPSGGSSADDGQLAGEGYSFALPAGWQDATEQFKQYSELIDRGAVNAAQSGEPFSDNVNVLRNADQDKLPPAQAEEQFTEELQTVASRVEVQPPTRIDGVAALHLTGRTESGEVMAVTDQYIAYVHRAYYVVTFVHEKSTPRTQREAEVATMLDSWTWD
jgi:hypothetical protein